MYKLGLGEAFGVDHACVFANVLEQLIVEI